MVQSCCVFMCKNRRLKGSPYTYHSFPRKDPERYKIWMSSIGRTGKDGKAWVPTKNDKVCSAHFLPEDFCVGINNKCLKPHAIPSVFKFKDKPIQNKSVLKGRSPKKRQAAHEVKPKAPSKTRKREPDHDYVGTSGQQDLQQTKEKGDNDDGGYVTPQSEKGTCSMSSRCLESQQQKSTSDRHSGIIMHRLPDQFAIAHLDAQQEMDDDEKEDERHKELETRLLEDLEKHRKSLHETVDRYINTPISELKTWQGTLPDKRQLYKDIEQIVGAAVAYLLEKCVDIADIFNRYNQVQFVKREPAVSGAEDSSDGEGESGETRKITETETLRRQKSPLKCEPAKICTETDEKDDNHVATSAEMVDTTLETGPSELEQRAAERSQKSSLTVEDNHEEDISESGSYKCNVCGQEFSQPLLLDAHRRVHFIGLKYKCTFCHRGFSTTAQFKYHLLTHPGERPHWCEKCGRNFQYHWQLNEHLAQVHAAMKVIFTCNFCGKNFQRMALLRRHSRLHLKNNPYRCHVCGRSMVGRAELHRHLLLHTGERPYRCDLCQASFTCTNNLFPHLRRHIQERPFECPECQKTFKSRSSLHYHVQTHRSDTPYLCDKCGQGFKFLIGLRNHKLTHIAEKNFKCEVCGKFYKTLRILTDHQKGHTAAKPFNCQTCGKGFFRRCQLLVHLGSHSDKRPFTCDVCGKGFKAKYDLSCHQKKIHENEGIPLEVRSFVCDVCGKSFRKEELAARHRELHSSGSAHQCDTCGKVYMARSALSKHRRKVHPKKNLNNDADMDEQWSSSHRGEIIDEGPQVTDDTRERLRLKLMEKAKLEGGGENESWPDISTEHQHPRTSVVE